MAERNEQTEATKKRLADEKAHREKARAEQQEAMKGVKPTPTQEENDLSASGEHILEHEHDGSPYEEDIATDKTKTRAMESKPDSRSDYQTRNDIAGPDAHVRCVDAAKTARMIETAKPRYRVKAGSSSLVTKAEGEAHAGPYFLPVTGGWLPADVGSSMNWWQNGHSVMGPSTQSAMVEACVSAYSQTVAMCPGDHWRLNDKGGRDRVTTSALARLLRHPNDYQSISDFLLNATRSLYLYGNAYALCLRNSRFEIDELHLMEPIQSYPRLATTGDVFYQLYGNDIIQRRLGAEELIVPQRDVLHIRLHTVRHRYPTPLVGESPICAAYPDIGVNAAIAQQQLKYYMNEARPSAVLSTDLVLDKDQVQYLRDRWNEQSQGLHKGGTPILTAGLKVQPWSQGGRDAATADMMKLSNEHIALAFRIPLQILGLGGTNYASTELLMQSWKASGLGFALNHIEEAIGLTFGLAGQPQEYVEFNTEALLRSALKDRIEALARGVQGGIYSPNDARQSEGLDAVPFGDEPRVQQQVVPLSAVDKMPPAPPAPPAAPPAPAASDQQPPSQKGDRDAIEREVRNLLPVPTESIAEEILLDSWREALAATLATERRQWERQRELIEAQAQTTILKLQAVVTELRQAVMSYASEQFVTLQKQVTDRLAELKDGEKGERGENGEQGQKGDQGEKGEPGEQGAGGGQGVPGEKGERGEKGAAGTLSAARSFEDGAVHYDGDVVLHHGSTYQARCDTARAPPHEDWVCIAARGKDAVMPKIVGTYREGEPYSAMNIVALGGSSFMARADDPGPCPGDGWQLIASAGKQGKPGLPGDRGEAGTRGERGLPGITPTILGWKIDRAAYTATPIMSDGSEVEPLQLRPMFEQFHDEAR